MINMPGKSYSGELPPLTATERVLREELMRGLEQIAGEEIGKHNYIFYEKLVAVSQFLETFSWKFYRVYQ